jgi:mono/diheme cytochrome c family protein
MSGKAMRGKWICTLLLAASAVSYAAGGSDWIKKVPAVDQSRTNPYAGQPDAIAAGRNLYANNCSRCHGANAEGHGSRPALVSERISGATDGQLAWLLKNGEPFHGMPSWGSMPEQQRWQIVAWLRSLNTTGERK